MSHGPAFFHARYLARSIEPYAPTESLKKGTLVHLWAELGEEAFWSRVVQIPEEVLGQSGRRVAATDKWEKEQLAQRPESICLKIDEIGEYHAQFNAILANSAFGDLASRTTDREFSVRWTDPATGLKLKCRPDAVTDDCIWDIKTTREQHPKNTFYQSVFKYGYHIQAVHYLAGLEAAGQGKSQFVFVVASTVPPSYHCHVVTLPLRLLSKARRQLMAAMADIKSRYTFNDWLPEDSGQVTELFVPERLMED